MQCDYFDAQECRSCTLMGQPYAAQLQSLQAYVATALHDRFPETSWDEPGFGAESHFRNKAKLVVGGTRTAPTFGILDAGGRGVDLRDCGLHEPGLHRTITGLADFITDLGLTPYDVPRRSGELKHLIVTHSPDGESMVRFVLRSPGQLGRLERALPGLQEAVPGVRVVSANLLPEHKAALEGDEEIILTEDDSLPMRVNEVTLHLRPRSFFQTNTAVASQLYRQAQQWISQVAPASVLDLFCGVGGFALHAATSGFDTSPAASLPRHTQPAFVRGVEISADAVASATRSAAAIARAGSDIRFETGDATTVLGAAGVVSRRSSASLPRSSTTLEGRSSASLPRSSTTLEGRSSASLPRSSTTLENRSATPQAPPADLVIVNPPRRGIGALAEQLEQSGTRHVLYSSCNVTSLAKDLAAMPSFAVSRARLFDMFPQTQHHEVLLLLER